MYSSGACDRYHYLTVRVYTETAWANPSSAISSSALGRRKLADFVPDFAVVVCLHSRPIQRPRARAPRPSLRLIWRRAGAIGGTETPRANQEACSPVMNYVTPQRGVLPMHCSANTSRGRQHRHSSSASPARARPPSADRTLIGDDEHGWSEHSVFNFEAAAMRR